MVNEQDRSLIVAFLHGELSPLEMQRFSERLKNEAELRQEFEALLATSEKLEDLFARKAETDFSAEETAALLKKAATPPPRSRRSLFVAGGAVFAASLALVIFTKVVKSPEDLQGPAPLPVAMEDRSAPPTPAETLPPVEPDSKGADSSGGAPPADLLVAGASEPPPPAAAAPEPPAAPAPVAETAPEPVPEPKKALAKNKVAGLQAKKIAKKAPEKKPKAQFLDVENAAESMEEVTAGPVIEPLAVAKMESRGAPKASHMETAQSEALSDEGSASESVSTDDSFAESESAPAADTGFVASEEPLATSSKKMGVIASKVKFSSGLKAKRALAHMQRQLDGKPSCTESTEISNAKRVQAVIHLKADGSVSRIETTPKSSAVSDCLKLRLDSRPEGFKSKAGGKITIQLKIF